MKAHALALLLLALPLACDEKKSDGDTDESADEDEPKKKKKKKPKGPEVQSCTLESGCSEYRTEQFRETQDTVKDTCKQGGGKYAEAACSRENALGTCKRNIGSATESTLVIYKIGKLTPELAANVCKDGEWKAIE